MQKSTVPEQIKKRTKTFQVVAVVFGNSESGLEIKLF
ncbi:hypothetical protein X474_03780 [Dethiosulfatarculus sandiegensis]|uniref:Uncharacterized protein n=1 Tax=Dethiosulfatarculus sandiegensis TaxID=1429043 RepID=A0A0D2GL35_9BACT|nr:hypothetical protein X474_03780 [Dethiosulfatarculus sandiegensis]